MKSTNTIDAARVGLLLSELRLPTLAARLSTPSTQCRAHSQEGAGDGAPWHTVSTFGSSISVAFGAKPTWTEGEFPADSVENDPQETLDVHCGNGFDPGFSPLSKYSSERIGCRLMSLGSTCDGAS
jgi:hypothetical protein